MKKSTQTLLVCLAVIIIIVALAGYLIFAKSPSAAGQQGQDSQKQQGKNFPYRQGGFNQTRNFRFNETQISELNDFFSSTTDISALQSYCQTNRIGCFYYCRVENMTSPICSQLNTTMMRGPRNMAGAPIGQAPAQ